MMRKAMSILVVALVMQMVFLPSVKAEESFNSFEFSLQIEKENPSLEKENIQWWALSFLFPGAGQIALGEYAKGVIYGITFIMVMFVAPAIIEGVFGGTFLLAGLFSGQFDSLDDMQAFFAQLAWVFRGMGVLTYAVNIVDAYTTQQDKQAELAHSNLRRVPFNIQVVRF